MDVALLWLGFALLFKHCIVEGPMQTNYIFAKKGIFMHWGGILHVVEHAIATIIIFMLAKIWLPISWKMLLTMTIVELVAHYLIDFLKANIGNNWFERDGIHGHMIIKDRRFWMAIIYDQAAHFATYLVMLYFIGQELLPTGGFMLSQLF